MKLRNFNLTFYFVTDHAARRQAMFISVAAGTIVGAGAQMWGASFDVAAVLCLLAIFLAESIQAISYREPAGKRKRFITTLSINPYLKRSAFTAAVLLLIPFLRIPHFEALAFERKLERAAEDPTDPKNITVAKQVLTNAQAVSIKLSPAVVEGAGKKFVNASKDNFAMWSDATTAFLNYRSFLNSNVISSALEGLAPHPVPNYKFKFRGSEPPPDEEGYGWVPSSYAARLNVLGEPDANTSVGEAYVLLKGGNIILDGMKMKNIVLENVEVYYYGWAVSVENVSFVNCRFKIAPHPNGNVENLINAALTNNSVTFIAVEPKGPPRLNDLYSAPQL